MVSLLLWNDNAFAFASAIPIRLNCIERNAYAAARALDANIYSSFTDGVHRVSFDKVVEVMKQTGHDLPSLYKETSEGGLAKDYTQMS